MKPRQAYNIWASQYDTSDNKTRDLEGVALRTVLADIPFTSCLEIGCGTGKNTQWLVERAKHVTAIDLSEEMLAKARAKVISDHVQFLQADITRNWSFRNQQYDLVSFSLVLEHIENLDHIFDETSRALVSGGYAYIGELHPFKQYTGSKARFDTAEGLHIVECYTHNVSDFTQAAKQHGLTLVDINEHFDDNDRTSIPRILTLLLKKE
ncbi:class I SAM-dependent methyltransferase [Pontibacter ruber]|uniref:Class I SAM-dependent methyltransferase n=1 Tax=Pontibacter ruber TaxID=1343895 RepID=A0ABW5D2B7_9BACT|nr:class I SAM-dependent methyltransferase [Pontibacter ruber]